MRIAPAALATVLASSVAYAQSVGPGGSSEPASVGPGASALAPSAPLGPVHPSGGGGSGYIGPGDIVSGAAAWYGMRAYSASYASSGGLAINVRNTVTNETCDVPVVAAGGLGNVENCSGSSAGDSLATFCAESSGTCAITEMYDQTGNGQNVTQATAANQPALNLSCINSLPCGVNGTTGALKTGTITALSQPVTYSAIAIRTGTPSFGEIIADDTTGAGISLQGHSTTANQLQLNSNLTNFAFTAADNIWHSITGVVNGASSSANVDGATTTGTTGTGAGKTARGLFASSTTASWPGDIAEGGVWNAALNSTQISNLCRNEQAYYGSGNFGAAC